MTDVLIAQTIIDARRRGMSCEDAQQLFVKLCRHGPPLAPPAGKRRINLNSLGQAVEVGEDERRS